jgi:hypothetical protein
LNIGGDIPQTAQCLASIFVSDWISLRDFVGNEVLRTTTLEYSFGLITKAMGKLR